MAEPAHSAVLRTKIQRVLIAAFAIGFIVLGAGYSSNFFSGEINYYTFNIIDALILGAAAIAAMVASPRVGFRASLASLVAAASIAAIEFSTLHLHLFHPHYGGPLGDIGHSAVVGVGLACVGLGLGGVFFRPKK